MTNDNQAADTRAHAILLRTLSEVKTVWIYVKTSNKSATSTT
jgi:hypothetical protein